ncbi:MAG: ferredoxin III, nif-specific [Peptococcaceae bacterium]|nr:ferredoxin III, nif-specific [Peptococcaceae bacterium]
MSVYKGLTYGGSEWTPEFVASIDQEKCIGCGRCVKVCSQGALGFGNLNDDEDADRMQSNIANKDNCIGCRACGKTCVKKAISFEPKLM